VPIGIDDDHVELGTSLRAWAEQQSTTAAIRDAEDDPEALGPWAARSAGMGLTSIALPEPIGGDGTLLDQAVALEAAAHGLVPGGLLTTTVAGLLGDEDLRAGVASGEITVGVGLRPSLEVVEGQLTGAVDVVAEAPTSTHVLLGAGDRWFVVPTALTEVETGTTPDLSRTVGSVRVDSLPIDESSDGAREVETDAAGVRRLLVTLGAAEASGVARWCLDTAVEYAGMREQFGQKIGAFQAIKHLCAEMLETSESVTAAAWDAARAAGDPEQQEFAALVAGTICFDGAVSVAKACIQVLGGIGFTFEHDAHLYLRRAVGLRSLLGPSSRYAAELADLAAGGARRTVHVDLAGVDDTFRAEVREHVGRIAALPGEDRRAALADSGYLTPHWPEPHGLGADPVQQLVIDEELARAGVNRPDLKIGGWAAPTIIAHGTDEQRKRFVGPTLTGELQWCQLFSEPGAGSDLASLRTRAVRAPAEESRTGWLLSGQKVWTSLAREADWGICLARTSTDGKPQAGITYFLVDMTSPGIEIRPLRELTGEAMFNEVFLDDVFVPDECVVGEVDGGWKLARTTLANERVAMAGSRLELSAERAVQLLAEGRDQRAGGEGVWSRQAQPPDEDRTAIGRTVAWATVVALLGTRATMRSIAGQGPGGESSVAKLVGVRSRQDSAELVVELLGDRVFSGDELSRAALHELLLTRCLSIAGGTTQVLRNVVGERILGLPRG
jgi:alkylation response protein AidB-like acyl-CoA dehydrogenase